MKAICIRSFQRHGGIARAGQPLELSGSEQSDPFVLAHVRLLGENEKPPAAAPAPYLGNGTPKTPPKVPAPVPGDATIAQLQEQLTALGVHWTKKMTKVQLTELLASARLAVAGAPAAPNRPATDPQQQ